MDDARLILGHTAMGLTEIALPLVVMAAVAVVLPWVLVRRGTRSHAEVAVVVWASAGFLLMAGAVVMGVMYAWRGVAVTDALAAHPFGTSWVLLTKSGMLALFWAPLLALVWYGMAQAVERRRGEDESRRR